MAAYAAVTSLMHILDQLHNHHCPPISLDTQQVESLNEIATLLQQFLEVYNSPFAYSDEADPLEIRIMNAAYAAEDAIESHIVKVIKTYSREETKSNFVEEEDDSSEEARYFEGSILDDQEEETRFRSESNCVEEEDDSLGETRYHEDSNEETRSTESNSVVDDQEEETRFSSESNCVEEEDDSLGETRYHEDSEEETRSTESNSVVDDQEEETRSSSESNSVQEDDDQEEETRSNSESNSVKGESDQEEETRFSSSEEVDLEVNCINLYEDLHQIIEEMDSIKKVAMKIDTEKEVVPYLSSRSSLAEQRLNTTMVCSDDVLLEIMDKLVSGSRRRQVIPITGMGGIGKTTLARTVYSKPLVKEYFDIRAWVTISQKFNTRDILDKLLCQTNNKMREDDLGSALHKYLFGRRFLIVMDDMWSIDAWDKIQRFFPNNENGSRVLVTTRLSGLTSQLTNDYSLVMKFLDRVRSWDLFSKTVFGEESCPLELEEIGRKIVHDCKGLPLSIVVVGGVLKKVERTSQRWKSIRKDLTLIVNLENDEHCLRLLKLSYNHLPGHLKPCFLYMGVFEEDYKIRVSMLVELWVSEGFLKPMNGKSLEIAAQGFLRDLIDRNLILIDGLKCSGDIKYCKMHDLLRDLCLREVRKYGFYHIKRQHSIPQGINSQRRLVIPKRNARFCVSQSVSLTRSIIYSFGSIRSCEDFGLLRMLHQYEFSAYGYRCNVKSLAFQCVNLRHLAARVRNMSSFLSSMILVWNLHTLIIFSSCECKAPIEIWKMAQLRRIEFIREALYLPDPPDERDDMVVVMENLQKLKGVKNFKCGEEVVKRCPNLRKLRITCFGHKSIDHYSVVNIERLCKLESLFISFEDQFYKFASLRELTFPHSLKSLSLHLVYDHELENALGKIGSLPLLQKLKLEGGYFGMGKWEIAGDQFPCLKYLSLYSCKGLKHWTTSQEHSSVIFPRLEHLHLTYIQKLKRIPSEIGDIATLQKIELEYCSKSVVMSARDIVDEQVELQGEEDLSFHVVVWLSDNQKELRRSLAGHPNFEVHND